MALIFEDGFESGSFVAGGWTLNGAPTVITTTPLLVDAHKAHVSYHANLTKSFGSPYGSLYFQFVCWYSGNVDVDIISFWRSGTCIATLYRKYSDSKLYVCRGATGGTVIGTSTHTVPDNNYPKIDVFYDPDPTNGRVIVKVEGVTEIDYSGQTVPGAQTELDRFDLFKYASLGQIDFDQIRVDDANWVVSQGYVAGNDFDSDPNCPLALSGQYDDFIYKNLVGPNIPVTTSNGKYPSRTILQPVKGGSGVKHIAATPNYIWWADADLPAGFPFKSGDTTKTGSFCFWWRPKALAGALICKGSDYASNQGSFMFDCRSPNYYPTFFWRRADTGLWIYCGLPAALTVDHEYHFGIVVDGKNKSLKIRLHDKTAGTTNNYTWTPAAEIAIDTFSYCFGSNGGAAGGNPCSGIWNELAFFKDLLNDTEIDQIRSDTYGVLLPPDSIKSATRCGVPAGFITPTVSATTCEGLDFPRVEDCRSATLAQPLVNALISPCRSQTRCKAITAYNSGFFLTL